MNAARPLLLALLAAVCACAPAPTSHGGCTEVGCEDGVSVDLGPLATRFADKLPLAVHLCIDSVCDDAIVASAADCHRAMTGGPSGPVPPLVILCVPGANGGVAMDASVTGAGLSSGSHVVAVAIKGADGAALFTHAETVALSESRPNGPTCEPVCRQGHVAMTP